MVRPSRSILDSSLDSERVPGGIFDVPPCTMHLYVGHECELMWCNPDNPDCPPPPDGIFRIAAVQTDSAGLKCYRVVPADLSDLVGMVVFPWEVRFRDAEIQRTRTDWPSRDLTTLD